MTKLSKLIGEGRVIVASVLCLLTIGLLVPSACAKPVRAPDYAADDGKDWLYNHAIAGKACPDEAAESDVDLFYVYPTLVGNEKIVIDGFRGIDDETMRDTATNMMTAVGAYCNTARCFAGMTHVYAPYYRQATLDTATDCATNAAGEVVIDANVKYLAKLCEGPAYGDVTNALTTYFAKWNKGRKLVLAAHSQGSAVLRLVMENYFTLPENQDKAKQIICSYQIGFGIGQSSIEKITAANGMTFATKADDTNVIVSYNTMGESASGNSVLLPPDTLAINPLSWSRSTDLADKSLNLGSLTSSIGTPDVIVPHLYGAQVADTGLNRGLVVVCKELNGKVLDPNLFGTGSLHGQDYAAYWENLRANVYDRGGNLAGFHKLCTTNFPKHLCVKELILETSKADPVGGTVWIQTNGLLKATVSLKAEEGYRLLQEGKEKSSAKVTAELSDLQPDGEFLVSSDQLAQIAVEWIQRVPDYAEATGKDWLFHHDIAEKRYEGEPSQDPGVDLFYLYPTSAKVSDDHTVDGICDVDDPYLRGPDGATNSWEMSGKVFGDFTRVYAPYYRQTPLDVEMTFTPMEGCWDEMTKYWYERAPYTDVTNALTHYFTKINPNGERPFVFAGHSHGSGMLILAMEHFFKDHKAWLKNMVACYAVGMGVSDKWEESVKDYAPIATNATDAGVYVFWNTEGAGTSEGMTSGLWPTNHVPGVNPITWSRDAASFASASLNIGGFTADDSGAVRPGLYDASNNVAHGTAVCSSPELAGSYIPVWMGFGEKSLHGWDYKLYWENVRANALQRIKTAKVKLGEPDYAQIPLAGTPIDYGDPYNWVTNTGTAKPLDVLYVYPTMMLEGDSTVVPVTDAMKEKAYGNSYVGAASAFAEYANVIIPAYRQLNMAAVTAAQALYIEPRDFVDYLKGGLPRTDLFAALDYYFTNLNVNAKRPFILAGHSQGSAMLKIAFEDYFRSNATRKGYLDNMVAAYALGYSFSREWCETFGVPFATGETDSGVIIGWNTEGPDAQGRSFVIEDGALAVNPMNWSTNLNTWAETEPDATIRERTATNYTYAAGTLVLVSTNSTEFLNPSMGFGEKSLHGLDWSLWYEAIKENGFKRAYPPVSQGITLWLQNVYTNRFTVMCETIGELPDFRLQYGEDYAMSVGMTSTNGLKEGTFVCKAEVTMNGAEGATVPYRLAIGTAPISGTEGTVRLWKNEDAAFTCSIWGDNQEGVQPYDWGHDVTSERYRCITNMFAHMANQKPDFGFTTGDLSSSADYDDEILPGELRGANDLFGRTIPYHLVWGNHDCVGTFLTEGYSDAAQRYFAPAASEKDGWFHLYRNGVLFIGVHWTWGQDGAEERYAEIAKGVEELLKTDRAKKAKFRILVQHAPIFLEVYNVLPKVNWFGDTRLLDVAKAGGVDVVFSGHTHAYERIARDGLVQVVNGGMGYLDHGERWYNNYGADTKVGGHQNTPLLWARQDPSSLNSQLSTLNRAEPVRMGCFQGYGMLSVEGDKLTYKAHAFNADGSYIGVADAFTLESKTVGKVEKVESVEKGVTVGLDLSRPIDNAAWGEYKTAIGEPFEYDGAHAHDPVVNVSKSEIGRFCAALNAGTPRANYRLPTVDELTAIFGGNLKCDVSEWTSDIDPNSGWCRILGGNKVSVDYTWCRVYDKPAMVSPDCHANYLGFRVINAEPSSVLPSAMDQALKALEGIANPAEVYLWKPMSGRLEDITADWTNGTQTAKYTYAAPVIFTGKGDLKYRVRREVAFNGGLAAPNATSLDLSHVLDLGVVLKPITVKGDFYGGVAADEWRFYLKCDALTLDNVKYRGQVFNAVTDDRTLNLVGTNDFSGAVMSVGLDSLLKDPYELFVTKLVAAEGDAMLWLRRLDFTTRGVAEEVLRTLVQTADFTVGENVSLVTSEDVLFGIKGATLKVDGAVDAAGVDISGHLLGLLPQEATVTGVGTLTTTHFGMCDKSTLNVGVSSVTTLSSVPYRTYADSASGCNVNYFDRAPDYALASGKDWLFNHALAGKACPDEAAESDVDLFYVYPTLSGGEQIVIDGFRGIDDATMRGAATNYMTAVGAYVGSGRCFADMTHVYAPFYRQATLNTAMDCATNNATGVLDADANDRYLAKLCEGPAYADVTNALTTYFAKWNNGRKLVFAAHSQGSALLRLVMENYFTLPENKDKAKLVVCSYQIGYGVSAAKMADITEGTKVKGQGLDFDGIKFASGATDVGVIVSYNTMSKVTTGYSILLPHDTLAINPITWTTGEDLADRSLNLGALTNAIGTADVIVPHLYSARVADTGAKRGEVVVCAELLGHELSESLFGEGSLHGNDYGAYWEDLHMNCYDRITAATGNAPVVGKPMDYGDKNSWMRLGDKDKSGSTGKPFDVFYVYPTSTGSSEYVAPVDDDMKERALGNYRQSVEPLESYANVYAPYYRQISATGIMADPTVDALQQNIARHVGKTDFFAALDYYFTNVNAGVVRPFVFASHSQGSASLKNAFEQYFVGEKKAYLAKMIAAYTVGYTFSTDWCAKYGVTFATGAADTGVLLTWNAEGPDAPALANMLTKDPHGQAINPLNWKRDDAYAPISENLGSFRDGELVAGVSDALLQPSARPGALIVSNATGYAYAPAALFGEESYHFDEWGMFQQNACANILARGKDLTGYCKLCTTNFPKHLCVKELILETSKADPVGGTVWIQTNGLLKATVSLKAEEGYRLLQEGKEKSSAKVTVELSDLQPDGEFLVSSDQLAQIAVEYIQRAPDYAEATGKDWLFHHDIAEKRYEGEPSQDPGVDLFYFYPTSVIVSDDHVVDGVCDIDDPVLRGPDGATNSWNLTAKVFGGFTRVYAPFYRQTPSDVEKPIGEQPNANANMRQYWYTHAPYQDVTNALTHYFTTINPNGKRPFVFAGHSHGSGMLTLVMEHFFAEEGRKEWLKNMVACYALGWGVSKDWEAKLNKDLEINVATNAADAGVYVFWNIYGPNTNTIETILYPDPETSAAAVNPILWTREKDAYAPASLNLGGYAADNSSSVSPGLYDASNNVANGTIICTSKEMESQYLAPSRMFGEHSLHLWDYMLYWDNIGANGLNRYATLTDQAYVDPYDFRVEHASFVVQTVGSDVLTGPAGAAVVEKGAQAFVVYTAEEGYLFGGKDSAATVALDTSVSPVRPAAGAVLPVARSASVRFERSSYEVLEGGALKVRVCRGEVEEAAQATLSYVRNTGSYSEAYLDGKRVTFPLSLSWSTYDYEPKEIVFQTTASARAEADKAFTLQLSAKVGEGETLTLAACTVTIVDAQGGAEAKPYVRALAWPANAGTVSGAGELATAKAYRTLSASAKSFATFAGWYRAKADNPDVIDLESPVEPYNPRDPKQIRVGYDSKQKKVVNEAGTYFAYFTNVLAVAAVVEPKAFDDMTGDPLPGVAGVRWQSGGCYWTTVGVKFSLPVDFLDDSGRGKLAVTKLPSGLAYNAKTDRIEGVPTKAGSYEAKFVASNAAGKHTVTYTFLVDEIPSGAVGTFYGVISEEGSDRTGIGSVAFTAGKTGSLSAKVLRRLSGTRSFSVKGYDYIDVLTLGVAMTNSYGEILEATLRLPEFAGENALLEGCAFGGVKKGTLGSNGETNGTFVAVRNAFATGDGDADAQQVLAAYKGTYDETLYATNGLGEVEEAVGTVQYKIQANGNVYLAAKVAKTHDGEKAVAAKTFTGTVTGGFLYDKARGVGGCAAALRSGTSLWSTDALFDYSTRAVMGQARNIRPNADQNVTEPVDVDEVVGDGPK